MTNINPLTLNQFKNLGEGIKDGSSVGEALENTLNPNQQQALISTLTSVCQDLYGGFFAAPEWLMGAASLREGAGGIRAAATLFTLGTYAEAAMAKQALQGCTSVSQAFVVGLSNTLGDLWALCCWLFAFVFSLFTTGNDTTNFITGPQDSSR